MKKCFCCINLRIGSMLTAAFNIMLGICIFFIDGTDYEDWFVIYPPATSAVICGAFLLYGAINYHKTATLLYLILSVISIALYGITSVLLFTLSHEVGASVGIVFLLIALMKCYFWICVFSFYQNLE